jgi:hypothetical protein
MLRTRKILSQQITVVCDVGLLNEAAKYRSVKRSRHQKSLCTDLKLYYIVLQLIRNTPVYTADAGRCSRPQQDVACVALLSSV